MNPPGPDHERPDSTGFFGAVPSFDEFGEVWDRSRYVSAPDDWLVVITDVMGSTAAIERGRYEDVNAIGVASLVALRNSVPDVQLPYVFGGDGATALVPGDRREAIERALRGVRARARSTLGLELRVGLVPVEELHASGHEVLVARFGASRHVAFAMFAGSGLAEAERLVKLPDGSHLVTDGDEAADFEGFECRWQPIPNRNGLVLSLIVQATADDRTAAARVYRSVVELLDDALGGLDDRPVAPDTLRLAPWTASFEREARIRSGATGGLTYRGRQLWARLSVIVGRVLFATGWDAMGFDGAHYREEVTLNTDYRKFDDTLRMVLDVTPEQADEIERSLAERHGAGELVYGTHRAPASIMTCMIGDYHGAHVHFVDGAGGGYALAARQLKRQLVNGGHS